MVQMSQMTMPTVPILLWQVPMVSLANWLEELGINPEHYEARDCRSSSHER